MHKFEYCCLKYIFDEKKHTFSEQISTSNKMNSLKLADKLCSSFQKMFSYLSQKLTYSSSN